MSKEVEAYILIAQQEWELNLGSNARNLAVEFSKTKPVIYVNPDVGVKTIMDHIGTDYGRNRLKLALGFGENTVQVAENLGYIRPKISLIQLTG